jgi:hypothetical protein
MLRCCAPLGHKGECTFVVDDERDYGKVKGDLC